MKVNKLHSKLSDKNGNIYNTLHPKIYHGNN